MPIIIVDEIPPFPAKEDHTQHNLKLVPPKSKIQSALFAVYIYHRMAAEAEGAGESAGVVLGGGAVLV